MPCRFRHRLSLLRLAQSRVAPWMARALALLLILGNAFAVAAPVQMLAMAASATMPAMHHAPGTMAAAIESVAVTRHSAGMHHHHSATLAAVVESADKAPHGGGCPCCDTGHCQCLQACNPLPQIAAETPAAAALAVCVPAPMRVAGPISIVDAPPLRPPIA